jgi:hypothetical protein
VSRQISKFPGNHQRAYKLFLFSILVILLTSCQLNTKQVPTEVVSVEPSNQTLQMSLMTKPEDIHLDEEIHILLENHSDQLISFPDDYGVKILAYSEKEEQWVEVGNRVNYVWGELENELAPFTETPFNQAVFRVWPYAEISMAPSRLQITVVGTVLEDDKPSEQTVTATLEVEVQK